MPPCGAGCLLVGLIRRRCGSKSIAFTNLGIHLNLDGDSQRFESRRDVAEFPERLDTTAQFVDPCNMLWILATPVLFAGLAAAQIDTSIVEKNRVALDSQSKDPVMKREGGTQPQDWPYDLTPGVMTHQVTFYVGGGTKLYGKMFLPAGFSRAAKTPAIVVGHGINALSIGIEKYAARFAARGFVAMAIDYQSYGFSDSELRLLEPDPTIDDHAVTEKTLRVLLKRTDLNNFKEVDDYRAAVSFLQGEPGIDPDRIGIWGSSNAGSVVIAVAGHDARVKAVVSQIAGTGAALPTAPVPIAPNAVDDMIKRARTGQGAEIDGGFSFRSKIDAYSNQRNREVRPGSTVDRIPETTKILSVLAEKDELGNPIVGATTAQKAFTAAGGTWQIVVLPGMTHFQMYNYTAFEVDSTLAADWFDKYLGKATPATAKTGSTGGGR
jgi:dienelactone hydrolase